MPPLQLPRPCTFVDLGGRAQPADLVAPWASLQRFAGVAGALGSVVLKIVAFGTVPDAGVLQAVQRQRLHQTLGKLSALMAHVWIMHNIMSMPMPRRSSGVCGRNLGDAGSIAARSSCSAPSPTDTNNLPRRVDESCAQKSCDPSAPHRSRRQGQGVRSVVGGCCRCRRQFLGSSRRRAPPGLVVLLVRNHTPRYGVCFGTDHDIGHPSQPRDCVVSSASAGQA